MGALQKLKAYFGMVPADEYLADEYSASDYYEDEYDAPRERYRDARYQEHDLDVRQDNFAPRNSYRAEPAALREHDYPPISARDRGRRAWSMDSAPTHGALAVDPMSEPLAKLHPVDNHESRALPKIVTLHPKSYTEARAIGEHYRDGTPVIVNLTDLDNADAKRLVDFSAGLVFALRGSMDRVTNKVFLLSPPNAFTDEDRLRITKGGF